jgi:hypothetical protein
MKNFFKNHSWLVFALIAIGLIYPSFQSGYIFSLDWAVKPFITFSDLNWYDPLGWIVCDFFSVIFTFAIFQRIFLFGLLFLLGLAGFRLVKKTNNLYAQYFSGLLLIFNPFIYARIVEQTMMIGAGSVAFFWFWIFLLEALEEGSWRKYFSSALIGGLAVSFFAHSAFFVGVVLAIFLLADYVRDKKWKVLAKRLFFFWLIVFVLNSNWIVATLSGSETWISGVRNFTQNDIETFRTRSIGDNSIFTTVLSMQGYWGEYQERFTSIQDNPFWKLAFILIFALAVFGLIGLWRKKAEVRPFLLLFLLAFVLAVGIASPIFKPFTLFLYQHVPFYLGLREPQKWVVILVFIYSYLGGWGVKQLLDIKKTKSYHKELGIFCAILPIIFSFSMLRGMHEHVVPRNFPVEWQSAKDYIETNQTDGKILFFPWHSYLKLDFAGKNITNPAKTYFGNGMISGDNTEFGKVYSHSFDEQTLGIEEYVSKGNDLLENANYENFSSDMSEMGIKMIMLAKTEDWQKYLWLETAPGVKKVLENDKLSVYELRKGKRQSK